MAFLQQLKIPLTLTENVDIEVRGEIYMSKVSFESLNELRKENPSYSLPRTYNNMGSRYRNNIKAMNDIPTKASNKSILFSGYTGPMYAIDFDNHIIVLVMCNIIHNSKLDRETRKSITVKIIDQIFNNIM